MKGAILSPEETALGEDRSGTGLIAGCHRCMCLPLFPFHLASVLFITLIFLLHLSSITVCLGPSLTRNVSRCVVGLKYHNLSCLTARIVVIELTILFCVAMRAFESTTPEEGPTSGLVGIYFIPRGLFPPVPFTLYVAVALHDLAIYSGLRRHSIAQWVRPTASCFLGRLSGTTARYKSRRGSLIVSSAYSRYFLSLYVPYAHSLLHILPRLIAFLSLLYFSSRSCRRSHRVASPGSYHVASLRLLASLLWAER